MRTDRDLGALPGRQIGDFQISFTYPLAVFVQQVEIERGGRNRFRAEVLRQGLTQIIALAGDGIDLAQFAHGEAQHRVAAAGRPSQDGIGGYRA